MDKSNKLFAIAAMALGLVLLTAISAYAMEFYPEDFQSSDLIFGLPTVLFAAGSFVVGYMALQNGLEKPTNPVKPIRWVEPHDKMEASDFLNWRTRLSKTLVGREDETRELLEWAKCGGGVQVRFLSGLGGAGKTRLAFEVADALRDFGWNAGEAEENTTELLPKADHQRLFLIVDYPEDDPDQTKAILQALVDLPPKAGPVRALFVSRYTKERWETEIGQIDSKLLLVRPKRQTLTLLKLDQDQAVEVFRNSVERCAGALDQLTPEIPEQSVREWLRKGRDKDLFHLPLFVSAAAVHCVLNDVQIVDLSAADVMTALVKRETRRMRGFGKEDGASQENPLVERLVALATVRGGLDIGALRNLAQEPPEGLTFPIDVIEWVENLNWWSVEARGLQPLRPDALGAVLVFDVLKNRAEDAPEWLWRVVSTVPEDKRSDWLAAADRIDHDLCRILGFADDQFAGWLAAMVAGKSERAQALEYVTRATGGPGTLRLAQTVGETLLQTTVVEDEKRVKLLNNHSIHLANLGDVDAAWMAGVEAVKICQDLATQKSEPHHLLLAASLTNRSRYLSRLGRSPDQAIGGVEVALELYRRASASSSDLAACLVVYARCLFDQGMADDALAAIEESLKIYGALPEHDLERYGPELAVSMANCSAALAEMGHEDDARILIEKALSVCRRLVETSPGSHEAKLAGILSSYSSRLSARQEHGRALKEMRESVKIRRQMAERMPRRYESELAKGLTNYSDRLSKSKYPTEALAVAKEAVSIRRRLVARDARRYEVYMALSLSVLSDRLEEIGANPEALVHCEEALQLFRKHQKRLPGFVGRYLTEVEADRKRLLGKLGEDG